MKTKQENQNTGLESRSEQVSTTNHNTAPAQAPSAPAPAQVEKKDNRLPIDAETRKQNRTLPTPKVLNLLHAQLPAAYRLAEVVGGRPDSGWVWIRFPDRPSGTDDLGRWRCHQQLAQLGFHWNRERQAWQHPCGKFSLGSQADPREKTTIREANSPFGASISWRAWEANSAYYPARIRRSTKPQTTAAPAAA